MPTSRIWEFNKGEWTEAYVFLKLLGSGRIYGAKPDLTKDANVFLDIINVFRFENGNELRYNRERGTSFDNIIGFENNSRFIIKTAPELEEKAQYLYDKIKEAKSGKRKFSVEDVQTFLEQFHFSSPKSPGFPPEYQERFGNKTDIIIETEDSRDHAHLKDGFSIKSHIGSNPTLFNSATASNIKYELEGCTDSIMHEVNSLDTFVGPDGMISAILANGLNPKLVPAKCNRIFRSNISIVDSQMLKFLDCVVRLQTGLLPGAQSSSSEDIVEAMTAINPLDSENPQAFYKAKMKDFHFASFSGLTASKTWDGSRRVTGGYIDVDKDGGLLYFRAVSDDVFCSYLYKHLYFDRPDRGVNKDLAVAKGRAFLAGRTMTAAEIDEIMYEIKEGERKKRPVKGDFGYIYKEEGKFYLSINFQTRFR